MKPTLLIPAAGMGSRYGGLKQIEKIGPSGETLMDYSIYDAIKAGFGKLIFVIREDFEQDFRKIFNEKRFKNSIQVDYAIQSLEKLPKGFNLNQNRVKPWGAAHALLMAADLIGGNFAVLNADDFYGSEAFEIIADFLQNTNPNSNEFCLVGYRLGNTLSQMGGVTRAICNTDSDMNLVSISEFHNLQINNDKIQGNNDAGIIQQFDANSLVSMNFWGFTKNYMINTEKLFAEFLSENINDLKAEFHIPFSVGKLIEKYSAKISVKETSAKWFGITWAEDKEIAREILKQKVLKGEYPDNLWDL